MPPKSGLAPELGEMSPEDFRRFGHDLIDWIADYFDNIDERPVLAENVGGVQHVI